MGCCKNAPATTDELRREIMFQRPVMVQNDSGGEDTTWEDFQMAWAKITPKIKREVMFAERIEPRTIHEIVVRFFPGLLASMRVVYDSRVFEIKAIVNVEEQNEWYKIECEERTGT